MQLGIRHFQRHGWAVIASLLVALVLLLDAMAACLDLHELIHHDAGAPEHECAVTLFAHGHVDAVAIEFPVIATTVPFATTPPVSFFIFTPAIENLPAGRAPPVSASSKV